MANAEYSSEDRAEIDQQNRERLPELRRQANALGLDPSWPIAQSTWEFHAMLDNPSVTNIIYDANVFDDDGRDAFDVNEQRGKDLNVHAMGWTKLRATEYGTVHTYDNAESWVEGQAVAVTHGSTRASVLGRATGVALDDSTIKAGEQASVRVGDRARASLSGQARALAQGEARVSAADDAVVIATQSSRVSAYDDAMVDAYDDVRVSANDRSLVSLSGRSHALADPLSMVALRNEGTLAARRVQGAPRWSGMDPVPLSTNAGEPVQTMHDLARFSRMEFMADRPAPAPALAQALAENKAHSVSSRESARPSTRQVPVRESLGLSNAGVSLGAGRESITGVLNEKIRGQIDAAKRRSNTLSAVESAGASVPSRQSGDSGFER